MDGLVTFQVRHPYAPRPTRFRGVVEYEGFRMKRYSIALPGETFDEARFASGRGLALSAVPEPAVTPDRPGVGIVIEHQGRDADYVVVAWWDRENELPVRVIVGDDSGWRPARGGESFCVWDLAVLAAERDLYVRTVLAPGGPDLDAYLSRCPQEASR
jgi:hypothetical protein